MVDIVTRTLGDTAKNAPLTNEEVDQNFINLKNGLENLPVSFDAQGKIAIGAKGIATGISPDSLKDLGGLAARDSLYCVTTDERAAFAIGIHSQMSDLNAAHFFGYASSNRPQYGALSIHSGGSYFTLEPDYMRIAVDNAQLFYGDPDSKSMEFGNPGWGATGNVTVSNPLTVRYGNSQARLTNNRLSFENPGAGTVTGNISLFVGTAFSSINFGPSSEATGKGSLTWDGVGCFQRELRGEPWTAAATIKSAAATATIVGAIQQPSEWSDAPTSPAAMKLFVRSAASNQQSVRADFINFYLGINGGFQLAGSLNYMSGRLQIYRPSDYRLKTDIVPLSSGVDLCRRLKPCHYTFKRDNQRAMGFIAHELAEVLPDLVIGEKDAVDSSGKIVAQTVSEDRLIPVLVSAVKELDIRLQKLEEINGR